MTESAVSGNPYIWRPKNHASEDIPRMLVDWEQFPDRLFFRSYSTGMVCLSRPAR